MKDKDTEEFMRRFQSQASESDKEKIAKDLHSMKKGPVAKIWNKVLTLWAMAKDTNAAWGSRALAIAALVYLVSPIDAIPDAIPVLGLTDDAAVLMAAFAKLASDLKKYQPVFNEHPEYSMAQLSLRFCIAHPACHTVIPGGKTQEQVRENVVASELSFITHEEFSV